MEKRVLIAVFLSFLVLYAYQALVPAPPPAPAERSRATTPAPQAVAPEAAQEQTEGAAGDAAPPEGSASTPEPGAAAPTDAVITEQGERQVTVETASVIATFTNRGAQVVSWRLKHYLDSEGKLVDLVPAALAPDTPRPFALRTDDPALGRRLNSALYRVTAGGQPAPDRIHRGGATTLTFEYQDASGLVARKVFGIPPDGYVVTYSSHVADGERALNPVLLWGPGLGDSVHIAGEGSSFATYVQRSQGILYKDGDVERIANVAEAPSHQGTFPFAGIDDHYFIATLVDPGLVRVQYEAVQAPVAGRSDARRDLVAWNVLFAKPPQDVRFFVGPKDFEVLRAVHPLLSEAIHFGIFQVLAVPLLNALKSINGYIGNYGWSIIILTILINIVMFPLRHKSVVSMRKMQELQPQIKAIQERYSKYKATDPERQKMNGELMALYKERGVNPASGCLPMLLTMPVLFAFYSLLSVAIEMRGAPFALWIRDLSAHDPYYITPLIMGATMFWQQRLTPVADPAQQKIMMLTPIMFLFFFLWAPSGLVIYWTVSNMLAIGQQYATNRIIGKPIVRQVRPPAERRLKNAGAGRTENARKA
jgi:YidC/Oxa1 family membrane protein insertase